MNKIYYCGDNSRKWQGDDPMNCKICGSNSGNINLFRINICKTCIEEIVNIDIWDSDYDKYKNLIKVLLGYYIGVSPKLNPVN